MMYGFGKIYSGEDCHLSLITHEIIFATKITVIKNFDNGDSLFLEHAYNFLNEFSGNGREDGVHVFDPPDF